MQIRGFSRGLSLSANGTGGCHVEQLWHFRKRRFRLFWNNVNHFGFRWHSITMVPPIFPNSPLLLFCLQHYMASASGWEYVSQCVGCRDANRDSVLSLTACVAPYEACTCNVCRRQHPSFRNLALRTVHYHMFNVLNLELTREVTYLQYLIACGFNLEDSLRLLPP
jgi:hypothetical protein